jgi:hypothetical protein
VVSQAENREELAVGLAVEALVAAVPGHKHHVDLGEAPALADQVEPGTAGATAVVKADQAQVEATMVQPTVHQSHAALPVADVLGSPPVPVNAGSTWAAAAIKALVPVHR